MATNNSSKIFDFPRTVLKTTVSTTQCPLTLTVDFSTGEGNFTPGTCSGLVLPLTVAGIPGTGTRYIVLNVTLSNGSPTSANWEITSSPPAAFPITQGAPATSLRIATHLIQDSQVSRIISCNNLSIFVSELFRTDKTGPLYAGERPFISWYRTGIG